MDGMMRWAMRCDRCDCEYHHDDGVGIEVDDEEVGVWTILTID